MTHITTLKTHGRTFEIVRHDGRFCAVEDKYIGADGRLNAVLYGPALHVGNTAAECISNTQRACEVDEIIAQGIDPIVACIMVVGKVDINTAIKMAASANAKIRKGADTNGC